MESGTLTPVSFLVLTFTNNSVALGIVFPSLDPGGFTFFIL